MPHFQIAGLYKGKRRVKAGTCKAEGDIFKGEPVAKEVNNQNKRDQLVEKYFRGDER